MRVVDLFAGCGGLSKGFEQANFELTLAIEQWKLAREVYQNNFDHAVSDLDLNDVDKAVKIVKKERPDLIIGGPPCQEFSAAGARVEGHKAQLTVAFARIVMKIQPKWFLIENVQGITKSEAWEEAKTLLTDAGYGITETVLNAAYFGVPQNRKRFFAIGRMEAPAGFLQAYLVQGQSEAPMSVREFVGDEFGIDFYYRHPRNWGRRGVFSLDEPSPTIRSTNRQVPPGYTAHPEDAGPLSLARALSSGERARVQTFPKNFKFTGHESHREIMIANAVPVSLAKHVGLAIQRFEQERSMPKSFEFREWLAQTHAYKPRSVSNVVSRLNRAAKILHSSVIPSDPLDIIHALERKTEYQDLPTAVRSQIKRAIRLHNEYFSQRTPGNNIKS